MGSGSGVSGSASGEKQLQSGMSASDGRERRLEPRTIEAQEGDEGGDGDGPGATEDAVVKIAVEGG